MISFQYLRRQAHSNMLLFARQFRPTASFRFKQGVLSAPCFLVLFFLGVSTTLALRQLPLLDWRFVGVLLLVPLLLSVRFWFIRPLLSLSLGFFWAVMHFSDHGEAMLPREYQNVDFVVIGEVVGLPQQRGADIKFELKINRIASSLPLSQLIGRKIQLSCYRCPKTIKADQRWQFTVRLKRPYGYASWGAFDYQKYQFRHQLVARGYVRESSEAQLLGTLGRSVNGWRERLREQLEAHIEPGVGRSMILALALGDKSSFSATQRQTLQTSGVAHLMAISGLHVGLVFMFTSQLFAWVLWPFARVFIRVPRQSLVMWPAMAAAIMYSALAGFAVSTQRALIMLLVYVLCRLLVRRLSLTQVLLRAIAVLMLLDPFSVLDTGFWLSCGAVWVIAISTQPHANVSLIWLQPKLWIGMMPITSLFFGQVSLVSPMVNLVLVPVFCVVLIPLTLIAICLLSIGAESLAAWSLGVLAIVYQQIYQGLEWVASLALARAFTPPLAIWHWLLVGLLIGASYLRSWCAPWLAAALVLAIIFNPSFGESNKLRVVLLDVGQGLALVVESDDQVLVYDVGPKYSSGFSTADAVLLPYLRYRGITAIDTLIISHADMDHIGGLGDLLEAFPVHRTYTSRLDKVPASQPCEAGHSWSMGATQLRFLSPDAGTPVGSNNRSCVLMLEHAGVRVLLTGDIEKQVERYLFRKPDSDLSADIMLVPHQGSKTSSTREFVDAVDPQLALVAAGYLNHYGHPHATVLERYYERQVSVMSTIESGSILLEIDNDDWRVSSYRQLAQRFWHYQKVSNRAR
ncbi:DNA internalization-related competence protein ComEC/Rec2 [Arenicella xantha]|uniref:Competence protein ComEC n=1 Tax=Arenicella xantha TaxID=644221 RepID=A0A395JMK8_9GAMM|nr:DNA internalization-related competence protein ComEC/Rec2 [Arenicella xantha]RBP50834.1 competence protein ComEC [Arenicella xantha]